MTYVGSDIISQEAYFRQLTDADPVLQTFLFESGEDVNEFYERTRNPAFHYPCLLLFMPFLDIDDNGYGLIEAQQDNSFAVLFKPTDSTNDARNEAVKQAQLTALRVIGVLRKDARSGRYRLPDQRKWRVRPMMNVGNTKACGALVDFKIITNANAVVGTSE